MNKIRSPRRAALAWAALILVACGGVTTVPAGDAGVTSGGSSSSGGPYDACMTKDDCTWGEIDHEILSHSDCICLLGCPHLPLSKTTVNRRNTQNNVLCTPGKDGKGNPCPVDDCAAPPELECRNGQCAAAHAGP